MLRFTASRFFQAIVVVFAVFTLTFFMVRLAPGDPLATEKAMHEDVRRALRERYHLDKSLGEQYVITLAAYLQGDLGPSMKNQGLWNARIIRDSFPVSLTIGLAALMIAICFGVPAGIVAAVRRNSWLDNAAMSLALVGICLPGFVMGPLLIALFGLKLRWFNVGGWFEPTDWVLPACTMGIIYAAYIARLTRGGMLEVLNQDFIRTAHAKGVPAWRIILKHALRGGLIPVVAYLGPALAGISTGSFIIETIFNLPGLGRHFVDAAVNKDYTLVLATAVLFSALLVFANFLSDILVAWLNPKVRLT
jgi:oligopeptide transport system permease protein